MKIEINKDKTSAIQRIGKRDYKKEMTTEKVLNTLIADEMFPVSLRWMNPITETYVFEYPPQMRLISVKSYQDDWNPKDNRAYLIPVPWQIYICQLGLHEKVHMFTRTEQLTSIHDVVNHHAMTNIYRDGSPCEPLNGMEIAAPSGIARCREMIDAIWMTSFNGGNYMENASRGMAHKAFKKESGCLLPTEVQEAGFYNFWIAEYYMWLEERSIEEILQWEWREVAPLSTLIDHLTGTTDFESLFRVTQEPLAEWKPTND